MELIRYRLKYTMDWDDSDPAHFESPSPVEAGDVIPVEGGFHHLVLRIEEATSPEPVLVLGKSGQDPLEATAQTLL
jgi:hypothetical protein